MALIDTLATIVALVAFMYALSGWLSSAHFLTRRRHGRKKRTG